jgi:MFS family permease
VIRPGRGQGLVRYIRRFSGFEPDARRFLLVTLVGGAATSLWWIDFNLFLAALGMSRSEIGLIAAAGSVAMAVSAFPASALSDRFGRRAVMIGGGLASVVAITGLIATADPLAILLLAVLFGAGSEAVQVVATPYMSEHSSPEHRSELFSLQFAIGSATNVIAAALGGVVARSIADGLGFQPDGPETYRVILVFAAILLGAGVAVMFRLTDDRPSRRRRAERAADRAAERLRGTPAASERARGLAPAELAASLGRAPGDHQPRSRGRSLTWAARFGLTVRDRRTFLRLLLPGFLISIGAGQVIPFLNLFVQRKFGLDLVALNGVFALTSVGTMAAILFQPVLARRFGRLRSVVLVQGTSIPFLLALGFSPILWTVIAAITVRNSLMNAGNPIMNAFSMDQVSSPERATLAAAMSLLWSAGWVIAGIYYSIVQAILGFDLGYALNFATIIVLYSIATVLEWHWFRDADSVSSLTPAAA